MKRELLAQLVAAHLTVREIAVAVDRSPTTVRHWLRRHGLQTTRAARRRAKAEVGPHQRFETVCRRHGRTDFVVRPDGTSACLRCRAEAVSDWRRRMKQRLVAEAGGRCALCGYDRCVAALHFRHRDPAQKRFAVGQGIARSLEVLREEAAKCDLLCSNCHAEVEAGIATLPKPAETAADHPAERTVRGSSMAERTAVNR